MKISATVASSISDAELIYRIEARAGSAGAAYDLLGVSRASWFRHKKAGQLPSEVRASIRAHLCLGNITFLDLLAGGDE